MKLRLSSKMGLFLTRRPKIETLLGYYRTIEPIDWRYSYFPKIDQVLIHLNGFSYFEHQNTANKENFNLFKIRFQNFHKIRLIVFIIVKNTNMIVHPQ